MNVRVDLDSPIRDGMEVKFKSPCDASEVTGLNVYYPVDGVLESQNFAFADANATDVGHIGALFAKDAVVKVILDLDTNMAFVQNADTNAYLEGRFDGIIDQFCPNFTESGSTVVCEPLGGYPLNVVSQIANASSVSLQHWGKNQIPFPYAMTERTINGIKITIGADGVIHFKGTATADFDRTVKTFYLDAGTYTWSANKHFEGKITIQLLELASETDSSIKSVLAQLRILDSYKPQTFTIAERKYVRFRILITNGSVLDDDIIVQLEPGNVATPYEPYHCDTFTADFGETIDGSYDWQSGVLTDASGNTQQLAPTEVLGLDGVNTLYSNTGDTTVSGKADPKAMFEKLTNAIIALGGNV